MIPKFTPLPVGYTDGNIQDRTLKQTKKLGRIGPGSQYLTRDYSFCYHCGPTWVFVDGHSTRLKDGHGCFPLCEECWAEMTPEQRLPYYRALWESWADPGYVAWEDIERAVLAGG